MVKPSSASYYPSCTVGLLPALCHLISKKLQPREEGGLWVLSSDCQCEVTGSACQITAKGWTHVSYGLRIESSLLTEDHCVPSARFPSLSWGQQVHRGGYNISGKRNTANCRPTGLLASASFPLLTLERPQAPLAKRPPRTWKNAQSSSGSTCRQLAGQWRDLRLKWFYFKCLLAWQLQGTQNPNSPVGAPGGEGLRALHQ